MESSQGPRSSRVVKRVEDVTEKQTIQSGSSSHRVTRVTKTKHLGRSGEGHFLKGERFDNKEESLKDLYI